MYRDYPIEKDLTKRSNYKIILSGKELEVYKYEREITYNMGSDISGIRVGSRDKSDRDRTKRSLTRSRTAIRRLIVSNVGMYNIFKPLFVTLTFKENVTDLKYANRIFSKYTQRLNQRLWAKGLSSARYLCVPEKQKRGAIHYHVLYFNLPYPRNLGFSLRSIWGEGHTHVRDIRSVRSIGAYVSKYLSKSFTDKLDPCQRTYFTSRKLYKPLTFRYPQALIDRGIDMSKLKLEYGNSYLSHIHGTVEYKKYLIN